MKYLKSLKTYRCLCGLIPLLFAMMSVATPCQAAMSEGAATLISQGYRITTYQITTEQPVIINTLKVTLNYQSTINPSQLANTLNALREVRIAGANFDLVQLSQTLTTTGLVEISAELTSETTLDHLPAIYQFAKQHTTSGNLYKVSTLTPFLSPDAKQSVANQMAQKLLEQAKQTIALLGGHDRIAIINYLPPVFQSDKLQRPMPVMFSMAARQADVTTTPIGLSMKTDATLTATVTYVHFNPQGENR